MKCKLKHAIGTLLSAGTVGTYNSEDDTFTGKTAIGIARVNMGDFPFKLYLEEIVDKPEPFKPTVGEECLVVTLSGKFFKVVPKYLGDTYIIITHLGSEILLYISEVTFKAIPPKTLTEQFEKEIHISIENGDNQTVQSILGDLGAKIVKQ